MAGQPSYNALSSTFLPLNKEIMSRYKLIECIYKNEVERSSGCRSIQNWLGGYVVLG
jgi:hypothetical protein